MNSQHSKSAILLHLYALFFVIATFGLIVLGGTVTSKGVGMAVPDWPGTYGYNMFLFPISMWTGGVFWEHTHRLAGSIIGMMTIGLCVMLWLIERRRAWLCWFGVATLAAVIGQGVMGGLRVTEIDYRWGVVHGVTAQLFLCMTVVIAAATSPWWRQRAEAAAGWRGVDGAGDRPLDHTGSAGSAGLGPSAPSPWVMRLSLLLLVVMVLQLALGATMRHRGAGLAIPDFPLAYGGVVPPTTQAAVDAAHAEATPWDLAGSHEGLHAAQTAHAASGGDGWHPRLVDVWIHFGHRLWAIVVVGAFVWLAMTVAMDAAVKWEGYQGLIWPVGLLAALLLAQVTLGAAVIWTTKHPEVATAHQALGSVTLATAALVSLRVGLLRHLLAQVNATAASNTQAGDPASPGDGGPAPRDVARTCESTNQPTASGQIGPVMGGAI